MMNRYRVKYRTIMAGNSCLSILLLVFLLVLTGCSEGLDKKEQTVNRPKKAVPVTIGFSEVKSVPVALKAIGTVEAFATVNIKSQITGTLKSIHFNEGDEVKKGDLLFTIDQRPFNAMLGQAQGNLARDRAELANAEKDLHRYSLAVGKGYVSSEQADAAATRVATLSATVKADEAAVETNRLQLEYCSIRSPIDGRTGELLVSEGNLIKANADEAMVTIKQIEPIKVSFTVPGNSLGDIQKYQAAGSLQVLIPGIKGEPLQGTFAFLDNRVDTTTGTILLKATFANKDRDLWPGRFVDVRMVLTTRPNTVVVPTPAIQVRQDGAHVYLVRADQTVEDLLVVTGMIADGETVIEQGLRGGERVVTNGQLQLTDGSLVQQRNGPGAGEPAAVPAGRDGDRAPAQAAEQPKDPQAGSAAVKGKS